MRVLGWPPWRGGGCSSAMAGWCNVLNSSPCSMHSVNATLVTARGIPGVNRCMWCACSHAPCSAHAVAWPCIPCVRGKVHPQLPSALTWAALMPHLLFPIFNVAGVLLAANSSRPRPKVGLTRPRQSKTGAECSKGHSKLLKSQQII